MNFLGILILICVLNFLDDLKKFQPQKFLQRKMGRHRWKEAILVSPSFSLSKELNYKALFVLENSKSLCKSRCIITKKREVEYIF